MTVAALALTLLILVAVAGWQRTGPGWAQPITGPLATALLVALAAVAHLTRADLGLDPAHLAAGARYAAAGAILIAAGYAAAVLIPATRRAFRDTRHRLTPGAALYTALVSVPLATVLVEEVAFRGVLWALLARDLGPTAATVGAALAFGVWHVLPGRDLADAAGAGHRRLTAVLVAVTFTTCAGVVLGELRHRSGSLLAPFGWHWAANGLGVLATAVVWAWRERRAEGADPTAG